MSLRYLPLLLLFLGLVKVANAQTNGGKPATRKPPAATLVRPGFPGGMDSLAHFLTSHIQFPEPEQKSGTEGRTFVRFLIEANGAVSHVETARSSGARAMDEEAVRVVSSMPPWIPGQYLNRPLRMSFVLPVTFRLEP